MKRPTSHNTRSLKVILGLGLFVVILGVGSIPTLTKATPVSNPNKRLSIYDGTLLIDGTATARLGNVGRDIETSGKMYLRPNLSDRGSYVEGVSDGVGQRLEVSGGLNGSDAIRARWAGITSTDDKRGAVFGHFHGAINNAIGAGVYGEVTGCGSGMSCYAGYFSGSSAYGVYAETGGSNLSTTPALQVTNTHPNGRAASFDGGVSAESWKLTGNVRGTCEWLDPPGVVAELSCPDDRILTGVRSDVDPDSAIYAVYCCEL